MQKKQNKTLHPRNLHNQRYDFKALIKSEPSLEQFVSLNKYNDLSINFADPKAVFTLNKALLSHFYKIKNWDIPLNYLCPPIPGRADYIHYIADLLAKSNNGKIPNGKNIKGLDIGVGANCIYPIIANSVYGWKVIGSDIDLVSIDSVNKIIESNNSLKGNIECRLQSNNDNIFIGIINKNDKFDFTICNPPFHKSAKEAQMGSSRKVKNLTNKKIKKPTLNFGGQQNELWCDGGEVSFIKKMIIQSVQYKQNCFWFTTLVSKKENLPTIYKVLKEVNPFEIHTIEMKQGQKITRFIAWTFLTKKLQNSWNLNN